MGDILFKYHPVNPTTWVYFSSLLLIALFFKFSRLWSVRNLDLIGLMALAPGLLLVYFGNHDKTPNELAGYIWLFSVAGFFMVRLLLDAIMVRRPLLEPNLSVGGLTFLGIALYVFLMANVLKMEAHLVAAPTPPAPALVEGEEPPPPVSGLDKYGPGNPLFHELGDFWAQPYLTSVMPAERDPATGKTPATDDSKTKADEKGTEKNGGKGTEKSTALEEAKTQPYELLPRIRAIIAQFFVVLGLVLIGYWHFDNIRTGIAVAVLYLLLPYTAQWTGQLTHALPAALLTWTVVFYRRPLLAGLLMGIAIGTFYYALFLLPLWIGFYWQRGWRRFVLAMLFGVGVMLAALWFKAPNPEEFWPGVRQTLGLAFPVGKEKLEGFWGLQSISFYRIPVLAAFVAVSFGLAIWPAQKNLGTLLSCSAVVMLGTQFWHAHHGGLYIAWYLPLMLLTIFRPNLEDRVALSVLGEGWFPRRKLQPNPADKAA